jgi:deoxyribodipyrimidine photo-lyase
VPQAPRPVVVWFRRDLRLPDHPALLAAVAAADRDGAEVVPLFIRDERLIGSGTMGVRRLDRLDGALAALERDLRAVRGRLVIRRGDPREVVPALVSETGASAVHATREHTPYARRRDAAVAARASLTLHDGALLVEPAAMGETRVFSPFHRRWQGLAGAAPLPAPERIRVPAWIPSEPAPEVTPDGSPEAHRRLARFAAGAAAGYANGRDRLDAEGTSRLGSDLHFGVLSPRETYAAVDEAAFRRQLAWRDWAHHVLWFRPEARRLGWRTDLRGLPWRTDEIDLMAWTEGRTGYPTVDAAMRQLASEGWMHNRARMIVASFLAKHLLLDWRLGEAHFLRELVDGDVANNAFGWQWVAGVGTDAAPYHRIFNPVLQGERFDPRGDWVRRFVPEVAGLPAPLIHRPWEAPGGPPAGYPARLVDHRLARDRALAWFAAHGRRAAPPGPTAD